MADPLLIPANSFNPLDDIDETDAALDERDQAEATLDFAYQNTFKTRHGRMVLQHLMDSAMHRTGYSDFLGLLNGIASGFARDGQLSMIHGIKSRIRSAEERKTNG